MKYMLKGIALVCCTYAFLNAMSPMQIAQRTKEFRSLLTQYRELATQGKGLTAPAQEIYSKAQAIITQLSRYTTVTALENELRNVHIQAQSSYGQDADEVFKNVLDFFGYASDLKGISTQADISRAGKRYYNDMANILMNQTYQVLARIYSIQGDTTRKDNGSFILGMTQQHSDVMSLIDMSRKKQGGALYWMNHGMDMVFELMNVFGDTKGNALYGAQASSYFTKSRGILLTHLYEVLQELYPTGQALGIKNNVLHLPKKESAQTFLEMRKNTGTTLLQVLKEDLAGYHNLVQFLTAVGFNDSAYNPNVNHIFGVIQKIVTDNKLNIEDATQSSLIDIIQAAQSLGTRSLFDDLKSISLYELASYRYQNKNRILAFDGLQSTFKYLALDQSLKVKNFFDLNDAINNARLSVKENNQIVLKQKHDTLAQDFQAAYEAGKQARQGEIDKLNDTIKKIQEFIKDLFKIDPTAYGQPYNAWVQGDKTKKDIQTKLDNALMVLAAKPQPSRDIMANLMSSLNDVSPFTAIPTKQ